MSATPLGWLWGRSEVRREILLRFFTQPGLETHALELAKQLNRPHQAVGRELKRLVAAGILAERMVGRARRVRLADRSPVVDSARALFDQTVGVEARLRSALEGISGVRGALVFGSRARGDERSNSDIDLLVVGKPDPTLLAAAVSRAEREVGRQVHVVVLEPAELRMPDSKAPTFLKQMRKEPRRAVLGDLSEFKL
ncbi:MAG TPA: nucleotidyltransferase domain-containing protein [Candidatus Micrarchaeaceae archaeon]|nr:nucleotidyltransferase domain-containing protein [Candidatus Micrarchaeaceae archaeon]